jgi:hypothetical protein
MEELTKKLQKLINDEADNKVLKIKGDVQSYKNFIANMLSDIEFTEQNGRDMLNDSKNEKLKFSEAEAEGFLRGVITIRNQIKDDLKYLED